jgi:hypothetical protein
VGHGTGFFILDGMTMATITIQNIAGLAYGFRWDPEFYQPVFTACRSKLKRGTGLSELLRNIRYGVQAEPIYREEGVNYIRALNLAECWIDGEILKIEKEQVPSDGYILNEGDILITRSGANCGDVGIITRDLKGSSFGSYTILLRLKESINPYAVFAFLISDTGRLQTLQIRYGSAQPNLSIPYLENLINIPQFGDALSMHLEKLVRDAIDLAHAQRVLYEEAEAELLGRAGWEDLSRQSSELCYQVGFGTLSGCGRIDAEHYQPKYERLVKRLRKIGGDYLRNFCPPPVKGVSPLYDASGECFIVNSQHLGTTGISYENLERTSKAFYESPMAQGARVYRDDVLTYATGAYIGRSNVWLTDMPTVAGIDCIITRPKRDICIPGYLGLFLNSPLGQLQAVQFSSGSAQRHIYPSDLARFFICLPQTESGKPDITWQEKLTAKVISAARAKAEARAKLEEAKKLVEETIKD